MIYYEDWTLAPLLGEQAWISVGMHSAEKEAILCVLGGHTKEQQEHLHFSLGLFLFLNLGHQGFYYNSTSSNKGIS
jgi:hypothetical protein